MVMTTTQASESGAVNLLRKVRITQKPPKIVGLLLLASMFLPFILLAVRGELPALSSIEAFKEWVNKASVPELSLSFFFLPLFVLMIVYYRQWTRPGVAGMLLLVFCAVYFGSMFIDTNYRAIVAKPDNVPITMMLLSTMFCI